MKKIFLIPLLTLVCSVMAMATVRTAGTFAQLQDALAASANGDEIQLTADIAYPTNGTGLINITKSITLDGQGHKISGYGSRGGQPNVISINYNNTSYVTVELKNLDIYSTQYRPLETRGYITKLTLDNVNITSTGGSSNPQGLTIGGTQTSAPYAQLVIKDSKISATASGYPVIFWNPTAVTLTNSDFSGYCALYFKDDSYGSTVNADACNFDAPNVHSGVSNAFAVFALETTNLTFNLNNCGMNAEKIGDQSQDVFSLSEWTPLTRRGGDITINFTGDNTHFSTTSSFIGNTYYYAQVDGKWTLITNDNKDQFNFAGTLSVNFTGGTYSVNPKDIAYYKTFYWDEESLEAETGNVTIPAGYEVQEVKQGGVTLYRVVKAAEKDGSGDPLYDLNDNVEGEGAGENPITSFELSDGSDMTLNQQVTTAGYVQVKDDAVAGATTVTVAQTAAGKDQTLVINNGLDVQGESQVIVKPGATLQIGEGGINTEKSENIVIEADETGAASLLLDPTITVNQMPDLTVKMTAKQIGRDAIGDYYWHRYACPVANISGWKKAGTLAGTTTYPTFIYKWDYAADKWVSTTWNAMVPLQGYTLTLASSWINWDGAEASDASTETGNLNIRQNVEYTFEGNLIGNTNQPLNFTAEGFNYFGNSYTGYMDVLTLLNGIESNFVDGTVYMWCNDPTDEEGNYQSYVGVSVNALVRDAGKNRLAKWQKEVAPMQTFILRLRGASSADEEVNYASAIWGNPRYGNTSSASPAPRRKVAAINNEDSYLEIVVKGLNGKGSKVSFTENFANSDAFESGYDVTKYMNENRINLYATVAGENLSDVVSNKLEGKTLSLQTKEDMYYTMSFKNVEGEAYAIRDNVTGIVTEIQEGTTYEFTAQPNSTIEGRFEIVPVAKVATAIDNTEVKANVKGIYTIMGQYLGENFDVLPAGVYVVDGVKIVK